MSRRASSAVGLQLRFSEQLRRKIEKAARDNDRSMNAEIVDRLENSFLQEKEAARETKVLNELGNISERTSELQKRFEEIVLKLPMGVSQKKVGDKS